MTKREAARQTRQQDTLRSLGFTRDEAAQLRRISMTLHRWFEHECNGTIQRDETDGLAYAYPTHHSSYADRRYGPIPDRETGARTRLARILAARNARMAESAAADDALPVAPLTAYVQTDPRGAALYILRPGDVPNGADVASGYTRGICVY